MKLIKLLIKYKWTGISFSVALTFVLTGWIWVWVRLRDVSQLTLHFSDYGGINKTGSIWDLHAFGLLGLIMLVLDWLISMALEERDWFLGKLTAFVGLVLGILIFIGFMAIMNVN
jgi:hypothetical protein